jgi:hypothetical protein
MFRRPRSHGRAGSLQHTDRAAGRSGKSRWLDRCAIARMARRASSARRNARRMTMKNPLDSIWGTIISGLVLTAILYAAVKSFLM